MSIQQKLRALLAMPRVTQVSLAARLGVSQSTVNRWLKGTEPEGAHRDALSDVYNEMLGLTPENNMMRVRFDLAENQQLKMVESADQSWVEIPPNGDVGLTAVRVCGDMFQPFFPDGTVVFFSQRVPPQDIEGSIAVVQVRDGNLFLRQIRHGSSPGVFTLTGGFSAEQRDIKLEWAAPITWAKLPRRGGMWVRDYPFEEFSG